MYARRFFRVQKFHAPGLAPVLDQTGAYHILPTGEAAYSARFLHAWGFYEGRAAALDANGWGHILADGSNLYAPCFAWCGNFQGARCTVRTATGEYFHIAADGTPAYASRYRYAGDYRDGCAVVICPKIGLCTHIDAFGLPVHGRWFLDLDVFHKGLARARDSGGWFHVDRRGLAAYGQRYSEVEPFYNGTALARTMAGHRVLIDTNGCIALDLERERPARGE